MQPIRPAPLRPGATIGVISVSAPEPVTEPEYFNRGLAELTRRGYDIVVSEWSSKQHGYVSASGDALAADLHQLFLDEGVAGIICAGGGINANRLLRHLSWDIIAAHPKVFMGVSNPTVLLNAITAHTGLVTFHGPSVVWDFGAEGGMPELTRTHCWGLLEHSAATYEVPVSEDWRWLRKGDMSGRLVGGNLASLQGLLGTRHEPNWDGAVFFWEDIAKPVNRLDMMLTHFRDVGVFDRITGMVVGKLVACEPSDNVTYDDMLLDVLRGYDFPILAEVPFGHTTEKLTLPIGAQLHIAPDDTALKFEFLY